MNLISLAFKFSSKCFGLDVPGIGQTPYAITQAKESYPGVHFFSLATFSTYSKKTRFALKFSSENLGFLSLQSF